MDALIGLVVVCGMAFIAVVLLDLFTADDEPAREDMTDGH